VDGSTVDPRWQPLWATKIPVRSCGASCPRMLGFLHTPLRLFPARLRLAWRRYGTVLTDSRKWSHRFRLPERSHSNATSPTTAANVVPHGTLRHTQQLGHLAVRLPLRMQYLQGHDLLLAELVRHPAALPATPAPTRRHQNYRIPPLSPSCPARTRNTSCPLKADSVRPLTGGGALVECLAWSDLASGSVSIRPDCFVSLSFGASYSHD